MGEKREYIASLDVVLGYKPSDAPADRLREFAGRSDNISDECGGSDDFVWLVPTYTTTPSLAATGFDIFVQLTPDHSKVDFGPADSHTPEYRYITAINDVRETRKVVSMCLFRSRQAVDVVPMGWDGRSCDLNKDRGGDYLYLLWKVAHEQEIIESSASDVGSRDTEVKVSRGAGGFGFR